MTPSQAAATAAMLTVGVVVVAWLRPQLRPRYPFPVMALSEAAAVEQARQTVRRLLDIEVGEWEVVSASWADREALGLVAEGRTELAEILAEAGMLGSWRVRFVGQDGTVLVGLATTGEVVHLEVGERVTARFWSGAGRERAVLEDSVLVALDGPRSAGFWRSRVQSPLAPAPECATGWASRLWPEVTVLGGRIVGVQLALRPTSAGLAAVAPAATSPRQLLATAAPVLALGLAAVFVLRLDAQLAVAEALMLGGAFFVAASWMVPGMRRQAMVFDYDDRIGWARSRAQATRSALLANTFGAVAAAVGVLIGAPLIASLSGPAMGILVQVWLGLVGGTVLLAVVVLVYVTVSRAGLVRLAPELVGAELRRFGQSSRSVLSISAQSAIAEECFIRLLMTAVVWQVTGSAVLGVVVSTVGWAALHDAGGVRPEWFRFAELALNGVVFGVFLIEVGLFSAIVAHFVFNGLILGIPLLARGNAVRREHQWR